MANPPFGYSLPYNQRRYLRDYYEDSLGDQQSNQALPPLTGSQTLSYSTSSQIAGITKFGAAIGAGIYIGNRKFGDKLGWDYYLQGIRAIEEYSPGKILRTFQLSNMLSPLESVSRMSRFTSGRQIAELQSTTAGRHWIEYLSKLTGEELAFSPDVVSEGISFEEGKLRVGRGGRVLLENVGILRNPVSVPSKFGQSYIRSLFGGPVPWAQNFTTAKIPFTNMAGEASEEAFLYIGGKSKLQSGKRFISGYGTSLVERFNQLAKMPFEHPSPVAAVFDKVPFLKGWNLGVESSSGMKTFGKLSLKFGLGLPLAYMAYQQADYYVRNFLPLNTTIFDQGITAAAATAWTGGEKFLSTMAEYTGAHFYREQQEEIAPGSTSLTKLLAFPIMGALGALGADYSHGVYQRMALQAREKIGATEAGVVSDAARKLFSRDLFGRPIKEGFLEKLSPEIQRLASTEAARMEQGTVGKMARWAIGQSERSGFLGKLWGRALTTKPWKLGAIAGGLLVAPFIPGALVPSKRPEELERLYSGEELVPIRKGRFWEMGNSPWEGGRIQAWVPHWYPRLISRAREKAIWGEDEPSPVSKWLQENFSYNLERMHYWDRPYPISAPAFQNVPLIGPLLGATIGRLVKPPVIMHSEELFQGEGYKRSPLGYGERLEISDLGEKAPGVPISPFGMKGVIGEQTNRMTDMIGLPGFVFSSIKERVTGTPDLFDQEAQLANAGEIASPSRAFYEQELGGMLFSNELFRRLYPHERRQIPQENPLSNQMAASWLPGPGDRSEDFTHGDPMARIPMGEIRLPGLGYCVHPNTKIWTLNGFKKAIDIRIGDYTLTSKGYKKILNIFTRKYSGEMKVIKSYGSLNSPVIITSDHQVKVIKINKCKYHKSNISKSRRPCKFSSFCINNNCYNYKNNKIEWLEAKDLEKGDYVTLPKLIKKDQFFNINVKDIVCSNLITYEENNIYQTWRLYKTSDKKLIRNKKINCKIKNNRNSWFIFGLYLAEGSLNRSTINFSLSDQEQFLSDKIKSVFGGNSTKKQGEEHCIVHKIGNKILAIYIENIFGRAESKKIPLNLNEKQFYWLLSGLIQGDGTIQKESYTLTVSTFYKELINNLLYYIAIFNIDCSITVRPCRKVLYKKTGQLIQSKESFEFRFYSSFTPKIKLEGNKNIKISKTKTISNFEIEDHRAFKVREVESFEYSGDVYDFEVEDIHEYTTSFILHNSTLHPEVAGLSPDQYPMINRLEILGDVSPYSKEYAKTSSILSKQKDLSEEDKARIEAVHERVKQGKTRREFTPYQYRDREMSASEVALTQINEESKEEKPDSWFSKVVGGYWETLAHNAETPLDYLTPVSPGAKLVHMRTAIEDYKQNQLYGSESRFWQHPIRDFIKPFLTTALHVTPERVEQKREINEYFDILKYIKYTRLKNVAATAKDENAVREFENQRRQTLFGINPFTYNYKHIMNALPRSERDYFDSFVDADMEEKARILEMVPRNEKPLLIAHWRMKNAENWKKAIEAGVISGSEEDRAEEEIESVYKDMKTEGFPINDSLKDEYLSTRFPNESYADWYRRVKLLPMELDGKAIPGPDWVGFSPQVSLEDLKLKVVEQIGGSPFDYDIWPDDIRSAARKPYLAEAAEELQNTMSSNDVRQRVIDVLYSHGVNPTQISVKPNYGGDNNRVNLQLEDDRSEDIRKLLSDKVRMM